MSCCFLCRSPHGVCVVRQACDCHEQDRVSDAQADRDHRARRMYRDPTGDTAVRWADKRGK